MSKEEKNEIVLSNDMVVVLESQKDSLTGIHENMDLLIQEAENITIDVTDKESYETAVELKRKIKAVHVNIKKKRNELKKPIIVLGRKLDAFTKSIYDPLVNAEKLVKGKMEEYEAEQDRIKKEQKDAQANEGKMRELIDRKLHDLNATLARINECKTQAELAVIEKELANLDLKEFGDRSDEAGFILGNLTQTCVTVKKALPEGEPIDEKDGFDLKDKGDALRKEVDNQGGQLTDVKMDGEIFLPESQREARIEREGEEEPVIVNVAEEGLPKTVSDTLEKKKEVIIPEIKSVAGKSSTKVGITGTAKKEVLGQGELDFGAVADAQAKKQEEPVKEEEQYFSENVVSEVLKNSVLPMALYEGTDESKVVKLVTVSAVSKPNENDMPSKLTLGLCYPDGRIVFGDYEFKEINSGEEE